ncbi:protein kinase 4-like [Varroa jacobsoni]|uniref:protein kinase 4-like n=1 Tax=Varroa jacobsoni TaxID=62625 RepID=UPI000BF624C4|nr:protein kinase 4-like [Varroa jacobsoni]
MPKHACADKVVASMTNNRFLVKYYSTFATNEAFLTIMEYIRGIDLHRLVKANRGVSHDICQVLLAQLGEGLQHMHLRGCIHRDIKDSDIQSPLYTYASSGFQRCLDIYRAGRIAIEDDILDAPYEDVLPRCSKEYRFQKFVER